MNDQQKAIARKCLAAAEANEMTFPAILGALGEAGFESYVIDFRSEKVTYYLATGEGIELTAQAEPTMVADVFNASALRQAILEAQTLAPGYTYKGFCKKAKAAGVAGYTVSLIGRRALYVARSAETHVEHFPP